MSTWAAQNEEVKAMVKRSVEDPNTIYVTLPGEEDIRHIFYEGEYVGWYRP